MSGPVAMLVYEMLAAATDKQATHLRVTSGAVPGLPGAGVYFFLDGAWEQETTTPEELYLPMVRRLGVMIGILPPKKGEPWFGGLAVQLPGDRVQHFLVAIDRGECLHALVELVDEAEALTRQQPRPPSPHPYRHG